MSCTIEENNLAFQSGLVKVLEERMVITQKQLEEAKQRVELLREVVKKQQSFI